jgi:LPPG:FO 2-phospho-L-lactate transferase
MKVVALAGGVGGAKLAHGLSLCMVPEELSIVVNTGDDFIHYGLQICPDLDTVCYTLGGLSDPERGWGRKDETWNALESLSSLHGLDWFRIGDRDLGTHLERTRLLTAGKRLTRITQDFCRIWGIQQSVFPMCDEKVTTMVKTMELGWLPFQEYFVKHRCEPKVQGFRFQGIRQAKLSDEVIKKIDGAELIVICPSNPWVSIDPILALPGLKRLIRNKKVCAVSPIVNGKAIKGPAAKMFQELSIEPSAPSVAQHYGKMIDCIVIDETDRQYAHEIEASGIIPIIAQTVMSNIDDRKKLASMIIEISSKK